jgi:hypothetical protein
MMNNEYISSDDFYIDQDKAKPISELFDTASYRHSDEFVLFRHDDTWHTSYTIDYLRLMYQFVHDISARFGFKSMTYKDRWEYSKVNHLHNYSQVTCYPAFKPDAIQPDLSCIAVVHLSDTQSSSDVGIYMPHVEFPKYEHYEIGDARFLAVSTLTSEYTTTVVRKMTKTPGEYDPGCSATQWYIDLEPNDDRAPVQPNQELTSFGTFEKLSAIPFDTEISGYVYFPYRANVPVRMAASCKCTISVDFDGEPFKVSDESFFYGRTEAECQASCDALILETGDTSYGGMSFSQYGTDSIYFIEDSPAETKTMSVPDAGYYPIRILFSAGDFPAFVHLDMGGYSDDKLYLYRQVSPDQITDIGEQAMMVNANVISAIENGTFDGWVYPDGTSFSRYQGQYDFDAAYRAYGGADGVFTVPKLTEFIRVNKCPACITDPLLSVEAQMGIGSHTHSISRNSLATGLQISVEIELPTSENGTGDPSWTYNVGYIHQGDKTAGWLVNKVSADAEISVSVTPGDNMRLSYIRDEREEKTHPAYNFIPMMIYIGNKKRSGI